MIIREVPMLSNSHVVLFTMLHSLHYFFVVKNKTLFIDSSQFGILDVLNVIIIVIQLKKNKGEKDDSQLPTLKNATAYCRTSPFFFRSDQKLRLKFNRVANSKSRQCARYVMYNRNTFVIP